MAGRIDGRMNLDPEGKMEDNGYSASIKQSFSDSSGLLPIASSFSTLAGGLSKGQQAQAVTACMCHCSNTLLVIPTSLSRQRFS